MNSDGDTPCSHDVGFPIRTSPDHRLLASSRGLSQLATSFIAFVRQGIHTYALSSLTIQFTCKHQQPAWCWDSIFAFTVHRRYYYLCTFAHPYSVFKQQSRKKDPKIPEESRSQPSLVSRRPAAGFFDSSPAKVVGLVRVELTTSPLSGVRSSHLSYRPADHSASLGGTLVELTGIEPVTS